MVNLNLISNNHCLELFDDLNKISGMITDIKETLEKEIYNSDIDLIYSGDIRYQNYEFANMRYEQIEKMLSYIKSRSDYQVAVEIDKVLVSIRLWFYDKLLEDSFFQKIPSSYLLASKVDTLIFDLKALDKKYFAIDEKYLWIFSREQLNDLELIILNDLYQVKRKINEFKEKYTRGMKADSIYIKNKK